MSENLVKVGNGETGLPADLNISVKWGADFSSSSFVLSAPGHDQIEIPFSMVEEWSNKKLSK